MASTDRLNTIEDPEIRKFLEENLESMASEVDTALRVVRIDPIVRQKQIDAAAKLSFSRLEEAILPGKGIDLTQVTKAVDKAIWNVLCNFDPNNKGIPDPVAAEAITENGVAMQLIDIVIVAAVTALSTAFPLMGAAFATSYGLILRNWLVSTIVKRLSEASSKHLAVYCARIPAD